MSCTIYAGLSVVLAGQRPTKTLRKEHQKVVHFAPESIVHYTPELIVHFTPEYSRNRYEIEKMPLGFNKLPEWLKVEPTHEKQTINAEFIIHGGVKNGRYRFFTGIRKTETENVFFGDDGYHQFEKKSFILFEFKEGNTVLNVYHFNQFTPPKPQRETFFTLLTK